MGTRNTPEKRTAFGPAAYQESLRKEQKRSVRGLLFLVLIVIGAMIYLRWARHQWGQEHHVNEILNGSLVIGYWIGTIACEVLFSMLGFKDHSTKLPPWVRKVRVLSGCLVSVVIFVLFLTCASNDI